MDKVTCPIVNKRLRSSPFIGKVVHIKTHHLRILYKNIYQIIFVITLITALTAFLSACLPLFAPD